MVWTCPKEAVENEEVKMWNINVQCDNVLEARRPDIILIDKKAQGDNHRYCCTSWFKSRGKRKEENKKRAWKIVETQNGRSLTDSDRSPWKCHKIIWWVDCKTRDNKQCWSDAKDSFAGNYEDLEKSVGDVKKPLSFVVKSSILDLAEFLHLLNCTATTLHKLSRQTGLQKNATPWKILVSGRN